MRTQSRSASGIVLLVSGLLAAASPAAAAILVSLAGDLVPGGGGATFTGFDEPIPVNGTVAFQGFDSVGQDGIYLKVNGTLAKIARGGDVTPAGSTYAFFDGPSMNNASTVVFTGNLAGPPNAAIFEKRLGAPLSVLVKAGDPAPGTTGTFTGFDDMAQNGLNDVAFLADFDEGGTPGQGVFLKRSGGPITMIVRTGDALPGTVGTQCNRPDGPAINDQRTVVFKTNVCGDPAFDGSIFARRAGGPIQAVLLMGAPAPASLGGTFIDIDFGRRGINNSNVLGILGATSTGAFAILSKPLAGAATVCVRDGASAPGTPGTLIGNFSSPSINASGAMAFESNIAGAPGVTRGIFACQQGATVSIALQGGAKPGTASTFGSNLSDPWLSDAGLVAFVDTLSPTGVFLGAGFGGPATVPTLSEWGMLLLALLLVIAAATRIEARSKGK